MRTTRALVCLFLLSVLSACEGQLDIVHGLTELEANEILVVLGEEDISAMKLKEEGRVVTWAIVVGESDSQRALSLLVKNRLPRTRANGLAEVYPAGGGGLIPTKSEEKAKFLMAMQGELERKLKKLPGVQEAHVSVVVPDKDIIRDLDTPPPPATASVMVVYNGGPKGQPPATEQEVKDLIAAAVEDLKSDNVQVLMKANDPEMFLVGTEADKEEGVQAVGEKIMGISVAHKKAGTKLKGILGALGGLAVLGLVLGIFGIIRSLSLSKKLSKAESEVNALKKARREP